MFAKHQSFRFLSVGRLKNIIVLSFNRKQRDSSISHFLYLSQTFVNYLGTLKGFECPRSDVSMRAFVQVEDILNICCELRLDKYKNSTVIKFGRFILNTCILWHL